MYQGSVPLFKEAVCYRALIILTYSIFWGAGRGFLIMIVVYVMGPKTLL